MRRQPRFESLPPNFKRMNGFLWRLRKSAGNYHFQQRRRNGQWAPVLPRYHNRLRQLDILFAAEIADRAGAAETPRAGNN